MANYTQNLILETFENMLERMPLEKITVTELTKECNIGRNTFYYHYEDIYALLDDALLKMLGLYENTIQGGDWKSVMKSLLYACRENKRVVYHIYHSLSRDRLEQYVFSRTDNSAYNFISQIAEERGVDPERTAAVADIVKYSIIGFILRFFWNDMRDDIDESVDKYGIYLDELIDKMLH
ncbi:MAG: TetR family transcriptional regulator C-terminal domain-containing protein [Coriobacteriales bacterium]|nr:TetR family transcriptional regulator C-terminal domain-containing protein [Coriobacteriales bacterium]